MSPEDKHFVDVVNRWRNDSTEIKRIKHLENALKSIESFGHGPGHARGYTYANMAQKALEEE